MEYIGIDIGGTKCAVVRGNDRGNIFDRVQLTTGPVHETLPALLDAAAAWKDGAAAAGISCGGPLNAARGVLLSPPNLPGWDNVPLVALVREHLGLPARLCNDANACALAEWRFGAGQGTNNMIFLTFGTGMGAGLILNGRLYEGAGGNAGEVGHWRLERFGPAGYGKVGSFEGFVSGGGLAQLGRTAALAQLQQGRAPAYCPTVADVSGITAQTIAQAAAAGDDTARQVYAQCGTLLGRGLALLIDCLNPEKIVIGSIYQRATALLQPAMEQAIREEALPAAAAAVSIVPAALGDLAALALAMDCEREEPPCRH